MSKKSILFVCKHNRFRSKIAEAFFKKYNKNKDYFASSAGLFPGRYPLDERQVKSASKFGIKLSGKPRPITTDLLVKTDIGIIVADNVPASIFEAEKYGKKIIVWSIEDDHSGLEENIEPIIKRIEDKVKEYVESL